MSSSSERWPSPLALGFRSASLSLIGYTAFVTVTFSCGLLGLPKLIRYTISSRFDVLIKYHHQIRSSLLLDGGAREPPQREHRLRRVPSRHSDWNDARRGLRARKVQVKSISLAVFTPVYFAVVGLKLDLIHSFDILFFLGSYSSPPRSKVERLGMGRLIKQKRLRASTLQ